jgi:hypothetical protein
MTPGQHPEKVKKRANKGKNLGVLFGNVQTSPVAQVMYAAIMAARTERQDDARDIVNDDDDPRVIDLLDMRAKADIAGDWKAVARADWCLEWIAFKRYIKRTPNAQ